MHRLQNNESAGRSSRSKDKEKGICTQESEGEAPLPVKDHLSRRDWLRERAPWRRSHIFRGRLSPSRQRGSKPRLKFRQAQGEGWPSRRVAFPKMNDLGCKCYQELY
jgi:hypothetical protein